MSATASADRCGAEDRRGAGTHERVAGLDRLSVQKTHAGMECDFESGWLIVVQSCALS